MQNLKKGEGGVGGVGKAANGIWCYLGVVWISTI